MFKAHSSFFTARYACVELIIKYNRIVDWFLIQGININELYLHTKISTT